MDKLYTLNEVLWMIGAVLALVAAQYAILRIVGPGQQRVVDRPRFIHVEVCRVVDEVLKPGDKIRFHDRTVRLTVLAKSIEIIEYNPDVEKTRIFCRNVSGSMYEVWYVKDSPEAVYAKIENAFYSQ